jgi:hypothetical protein
MNPEKLSRWLTIVANIGILAGLALVAYELNQNARLARADLINDGNNIANQIYSSALGENPLEAVTRAYECPEKMNFTDFVVVDIYLFTAMNNFYRNYQLSKEGLFSDTDWKSNVDAYSLWFLKKGFSRVWWEEEGKTFFDPEFSDYVDTQLAKEGLDMHEYWRKIQDKLGLPEQLRNQKSDACHSNRHEPSAT